MDVVEVLMVVLLGGMTTDKEEDDDDAEVEDEDEEDEPVESRSTQAVPRSPVLLNVSAAPLPKVTSNLVDCTWAPSRA